jgi:chromosome segregation ATPase
MIDNKEAYLEKFQGKLDEWKADIDKLKAKATQAKADLKIEINRRIGDMEGQQQEVEKKIQQLRQASEGAWQEIKVGVQQVWDKLEDAVKSAKSKFS